MLIKRTLTDAGGNLVYQLLQEHCSHASAAGAFQVAKKGSLISKSIKNTSTTVKLEGDTYLFEEVV